MLETLYIDVHTHHLKTTEGVKSIVNFFPEEVKVENLSNQQISIGIHPWHIEKKEANNKLELVDKLASINRVIAIGEIGLDKLTSTPFDSQKVFFLRQIELAEKFNKPIIIHCVRCFPELIAVKKSVKTSTPWIIHGFRNNFQIAQDLLKQNCFISFGEALLFDRKNQELFARMPINQVFLETDESSFSIADIYAKAAQLKGLPLNDLKKALFKNYKNVFGSK